MRRERAKKKKILVSIIESSFEPSRAIRNGSFFEMPFMPATDQWI